jgi:hypothetical protein
MRLGEDWPERSWTPYGLPSGFALAGFHTLAHCELLELALRLSLLDDLPGRGQVQRALRGDAASSQVMHARIQLEVAALAQRIGRAAALESRQISPKDPVDVLVGHMPVETFAVPSEDREIEHRQAADEMMHWLFMLGVVHGVHVAGKVQTLLDHHKRETLGEEIIAASRRLENGTGEQILSDTDYQLVVLRREHAAGRALTGPTTRSDAWRKPARRLHKKAEQARSSGATWLRRDIRNGLWQFTELRKLSLADRAMQLAAATRQILSAHPHIHGAVLSCGSLHAQGYFTDESTVGELGEIGLRRVIFPLRVRELIVVPASLESSEEAEDWYAIYDGEADWLTSGLERTGCLPRK